jgi:hypothetical protein
MKSIDQFGIGAYQNRLENPLPGADPAIPRLVRNKVRHPTPWATGAPADSLDSLFTGQGFLFAPSSLEGMEILACVVFKQSERTVFTGDD